QSGNVRTSQSGNLHHDRHSVIVQLWQPRLRGEHGHARPTAGPSDLLESSRPSSRSTVLSLKPTGGEPKRGSSGNKPNRMGWPPGGSCLQHGAVPASNIGGRCQLLRGGQENPDATVGRSAARHVGSGAAL